MMRIDFYRINILCTHSIFIKIRILQYSNHSFLNTILFERDKRFERSINTTIINGKKN